MYPSALATRLPLHVCPEYRTQSRVLLLLVLLVPLLLLLSSTLSRRWPLQTLARAKLFLPMLLLLVVLVVGRGKKSESMMMWRRRIS
jgi:choline-glycine betaine transporter